MENSPPWFTAALEPHRIAPTSMLSIAEKFAPGGSVRFPGEHVRNPVATVFDAWGLQQGCPQVRCRRGEGTTQPQPPWFLVDPEGAAATWTGLEEPRCREA